MNSPTTPRLAPGLPTQRLTRAVRNPTNGSQMNATAFSMSEAEAVERAKRGMAWLSKLFMACISVASILFAFG